MACASWSCLRHLTREDEDLLARVEDKGRYHGHAFIVFGSQTSRCTVDDDVTSSLTTGRAGRVSREVCATTIGIAHQAALCLQRRHQLEAVHLRHHEVEQDHVGQFRRDRVERERAIRRLANPPAPDPRIVRTSGRCSSSFDGKAVARCTGTARA